ncbi:MAG: endonuclease [Flavobacteriales bacterium]|nr:endonuclease [Flavobacteriales bacterium]
MRKLVISVTILITQLCCFAQAPAGYYDSALGLSGDNARSALYNIINSHTTIAYDNIWGYFNNTDITGGIVTDIYSTYSYTFNTDQCGQYSAEGDCYNREHSVPQDWFNGSSPMYSDLFHIYPTDGFVNGQRSNLPYGEVGSATYTSTNGCKKGNNIYPGYSGTVFEPADDYKGDLARTYFYVATRYMNVAAGWTGESFQGNTLTNWTLNMMVGWHQNDPVSQKEIDRNNTIYTIQGNRNPYIDHPNWVNRVFIWPTSVVAIKDQKNKLWYSNNSIHFDSRTKSESPLLIYDSLGKLISSNTISQGINSYQINLTPGIYFATYQNTQLKLVVL